MIKKVSRRSSHTPEIISVLILTLAMMLTYINLNFVSFFNVLLMYLSLFGIFILIALAFRGFGIKLSLQRDLNKYSFKINLRNNKNIVIALIIVTKVIVTFLVILFDVPSVVFFTLLSFLDIFSTKFIRYVKNTKWLMWDHLAWTVIRIVYYFSFVPWVMMAFVGYLIITALMYYNVDYIYLKAFIPDVISIAVLYGTIYANYLFVLELLQFGISVYLYVFD